VRIRKVINRVYGGKVYYRWVLSISPKDVRELGWTDGQELGTEVHGATLSILPAPRQRTARGRLSMDSFEGQIQRKTIPRR
jgi:hypothetical protein